MLFICEGCKMSTALGAHAQAFYAFQCLACGSQKGDILPEDDTEANWLNGEFPPSRKIIPTGGDAPSHPLSVGNTVEASGPLSDEIIDLYTHIWKLEAQWRDDEHWENKLRYLR